MKALVSLWVSFVMFFVSFIPGFIPPDTAAAGTSYPYIFVHGLFGWGENEGIDATLPYWGATSCNLIQNIQAEGYECYDASVGPISSNWDRACELYAQLTGSRVDYGAAHAKAHNHLRYGRTYDVPLIDGWGKKDAAGKIQKINLVGHSFGGNTIRLLVGLLRNGASEEVAAANDVSPLFTGGKANWVNSCVTICTPNNGSTCAYIADELHIRNLLMLAIYSYAGVMGRSPANGYVDFHLEQFGLTNIPGEETTSDFIVRAIDLMLEQKYDNAAYDLSPDGVQKLNEYAGVDEHVYYFSYPFSTTKAVPLTGTHVAIPSTLVVLRPFAAMMGVYAKNRITSYPIDKTWLENDGLVNLVSAKYPFGNPHTAYDPSGIRTGIWNVMPTSTGDHGNAIGIGISEAQTMDFYNSIINMIESLPTK